MLQRTFITEQIFTIANVLTPDECRTQLEQAQLIGFDEQRYGQRTTSEIRRRATTDEPATAAFLWSRIADLLPSLTSIYQSTLKPEPPTREPLGAYAPVGLNERLRYYRYEPGECFPPHFDIAYEPAADIRSFLTFIVYLNEDCRGGETKFGDVAINPRTGTALLFPHELIHEGAAILDGWKCVLRSDVMYRQQTN